MFRTAILVILTYAAVYFAFELITENDLSKLNGSMYTYFVINGVLLLFTYPLLFLVEKTFGFTSNVTLVELSNINNSLLRRMSETVPGTFQHSMQVANLAAEAANRIGANSQLVRTGALYHDIGKMENPAFFTENQSGGVNPHKNLGYEQSAQVVIGHVTDGLKLAEKNNLPKVIKDFITTHHGRGKTKYFYISWKNEHPGETRQRVIHLSRSQPFQQGASHPDDGGFRRGSLAQPARIYGREHQQPGRQDYRFAGGGRLFQGVPRHVQGHSNGKSRFQRKIENHLPHPHQLPGT